VTLSLWLIGGLKTVRAILLVIAQFVCVIFLRWYMFTSLSHDFLMSVQAGGIAGSALVQGLTAGDGVELAITKLEPGMSIVRGVFLEAFLTAMLVFTVLMLAAESRCSSFLCIKYRHR
jgi:aquaporin related protein